MAELGVAMSETGSCLNPSQVTPGLFCCACFSEDQRWYRVAVNQVDSSNVSVYVTILFLVALGVPFQ